METLLLIDGNSIMHRAYHALPPLNAKDQTPTNVVYGFFSMLNKAIIDFSPNYLATVFDTPKPTFRNKIFAQYQIQRPKIEDNFKIQIPLVKEAIDLGGIFRVEKDGFEADDLIGTIVNKFNQPQLRIIIITGDRDLFQLINDNVYIVTPHIGLSEIKIYDQNEVLKKFGIAPSKIVDYKALVGDQSDNYPGAKGIGPKTAVKLINQFGTVENLYENLEKVGSEKLREILAVEKENVFLSKKLATILDNVDLNLDLQQLKFNSFDPKLGDFFDQYQIYSLKKRIFENKNNNTKKKKEERKSTEEQNIKQIEMF
jgi:DNA polymerase-1